jgi:hypothetical protein
VVDGTGGLVLSQNQPATGQEINLAFLMNVLWRRRLIVLGLPTLGLAVGILYGVFAERRWEATVNIRPGITSFDQEGVPNRQWRMRDVTRWYDKKMYEHELRQRLEVPDGVRVKIEAEFIAPSLHDYFGGEVIILSTLASSPELAVAILDSSLAVFNSSSEADSLGSQIRLSRDHLRLQIRRQESMLERLEGEDLTLDLQIESARAESLLIVAEQQQLLLDLDKLAKKEHFLERRLNTLRDEEPRLTADLTQLDHTLRRLNTTAGDQQSPVEIPSWVRRDAVLDGSTVIESLTRAKLQVQQALALNRALQDSLLHATEVNLLDKAKLEIYRETSIRAKLREAMRQIGELVLNRRIDLPARRRVILTDIDEYQTRLRALAPLQRVGSTVVSQKPVRPRPLRAVLILVLGGGLGGLCLGFIWEYVHSQRRAIFHS